MANKKLAATITIGGAVASSLKSAFGDIKGQVGQVGSALKHLENQQRTLSTAIQTFGKMGRNVDGMRSRYTQLTQQIDRVRNAQQRLNKVQQAQAANKDKQSAYRGQIFDAVALGATAATPVVMAAQFEAAMLGVAKQVTGARDASGQLTSVYYDMGKQIQLLAREVPLATNELADMVTAGARMGVAKDELLGFTRTAAMMADAFELPAGELADNMGKIAGLFKIPIPAIGELADSVNFLDDNAISKGGDIIEFLSRTGGVASAVSVTGKEMAALGSTLLTLGERTETAGTAVNAMFQKFAAADKGTKSFKSALSELGISAAAVQQGMQTDATGTMMSVMEAIGKLPKEKQLGVMVELVGLEHSDTLAKLANNTGEWRRQLALANSEAAKGSMSREFSARLQTTNAQWQLMKNRTAEVAVNLGSVLLPAINDTFNAIAPVVSAIADFARNNPELTKAIVGTAVALTTLKISTMAACYGFTFLKGGVLQVQGSLAKLRAGMALAALQMPALAAGIRAVGVAFVSTGIGALITAVALGGLAIYRNWDGIKAFMTGTLQGISTGVQPVISMFRDLWQSLEPIHPVFNAIGSAIKAVWQWFTSLATPVKYSSDELGKAAGAGKTFGESLAAGIQVAMIPLKLLIDSIIWINGNIGAALEKASAFKSAAGNFAGAAWDKTKAFFGTDDVASPQPQHSTAPNLPIPVMAGSKRGGTYQDNSQTTMQITQLPGENQQALAKRIVAEQERQRGVRQRSMMMDGAIPQ